MLSLSLLTQVPLSHLPNIILYMYPSIAADSLHLQYPATHEPLPPSAAAVADFIPPLPGGRYMDPDCKGSSVVKRDDL